MINNDDDDDDDIVRTAGRNRARTENRFWKYLLDTHVSAVKRNFVAFFSYYL